MIGRVCVWERESVFVCVYVQICRYRTAHAADGTLWRWLEGCATRTPQQRQIEHDFVPCIHVCVRVCVYWGVFAIRSMYILNGIYTYIHIYLYVYIYIFIFIYIYIYTYIYMYENIYIYIYIYTYINLYTHVHTYIYMYIYMQLPVNVYICIYIYTYTCI